MITAPSSSQTTRRSVLNCAELSPALVDIPQSRRQHETGLKHQGNKERFIRNLYKQGNQAKHAKAQEAIEIAKIEAVSLARQFRGSR